MKAFARTSSKNLDDPRGGVAARWFSSGVVVRWTRFAPWALDGGNPRAIARCVAETHFGPSKMACPF